jgi:hypothetical protein
MILQHSARIERPAARARVGEGGGGTLEQRSGGDEGEKQIGRCGAEKHRLAPTRTPIHI